MRKWSWLSLLVALTLVSLTPAAGVASPPEYTMTDLGIIGPGPYGESAVAGINNRGQIVGRSALNLASATHLVLWNRGELSDLGTFPGSSLEWVQPMAINARGQVVGRIFEVGEGNTVFPGFTFADTAGFIYEDGLWTLIKAESAVASKAIDINARGQVLGSEYDSVHGLRTFIWEDGVTTYLDGLSLDEPTAINDRGQVVGWYYDDSYRARSVIWDDGVVTEIDKPGASTQVQDLNNRGQAVGSYFVSGTRQAFVWEDSELADLSIPAGAWWSQASGINNRGQIAGAVSLTTMPGDTHAVLWDGGFVVDLGSAGYGCSAADLNARGQVVGGCGMQYGPRAFLWER